MTKENSQAGITKPSQKPFKHFQVKISLNVISRLDVFLKGNYGHSRSYWQEQIKNSLVKVDGKIAKAHQIVRQNQLVEFESKLAKHKKNPKPHIQVIYEDNNYLAVNKPPNVLVHKSDNSNTLALNEIFKEKINDKDGLRSGIVHRLDKGTSGVVILAKNNQARKYLSNLFKKRLVKKTYLALVWGKPKLKQAIIKLPISRSKTKRYKMAVDQFGKQAVSVYKVIKYYGKYCLVEIKLVTGRTHQIRAHFEHLGYPIVGDKIYSNKKDNLSRQFLHAKRLTFIDQDDKKIDIHAELTDDLKLFLDSL